MVAAHTDPGRRRSRLQSGTSLPSAPIARPASVLPRKGGIAITRQPAAHQAFAALHARSSAASPEQLSSICDHPDRMPRQYRESVLAPGFLRVTHEAGDRDGRAPQDPSILALTRRYWLGTKYPWSSVIPLPRNLSAPVITMEIVTPGGTTRPVVRCA